MYFAALQLRRPPRPRPPQPRPEQRPPQRLSHATKRTTQPTRFPAVCAPSAPMQASVHRIKFLLALARTSFLQVVPTVTKHAGHALLLIVPTHAQLVLLDCCSQSTGPSVLHPARRTSTRMAYSARHAHPAAALAHLLHCAHRVRQATICSTETARQTATDNPTTTKIRRMARATRVTLATLPEATTILADSAHWHRTFFVFLSRCARPISSRRMRLRKPRTAHAKIWRRHALPGSSSRGQQQHPTVSA